MTWDRLGRYPSASEVEGHPIDYNVRLRTQVGKDTWKHGLIILIVDVNMVPVNPVSD